MADFSGVASASLVPGWNTVTTGTAGPSNQSSYTMPVHYPDGTLVPPGTNIPPGTQLAIFKGSASEYQNSLNAGSGGYEVTTGNQRPLDAASILDTNSQIQTRAATLAQQGARDAELARQFGLEFAQRGQIAQQQYDIDVQQLGLQRADLLYRQRLADAQGMFMESAAQLDIAGFGLAQNQFNASQRQFKASAELDINKQLADRSGPQDWIAYNRLLNGLNAPNPTKSTTIDPYARLDGLYEQSNIALPNAPQWQSVVGDVPGITGSGPVSNTGGTGIFSGQNTSSQAPAATAAAAAAAGPQNGPVDPSQVPQYAQGTVPAPYPSVVPPPSKIGYTQVPGGPPPPNPVHYPYAEQGGMFSNSVVTGDSKSGRENQELVMSNAPISVVPIPNDSLPRMPYAESGGTYGTDLNAQTNTYNQYDPSVLGSQPFYQKLTGQSQSKEFGGFGAALDNPEYGLSNVPFNINMRNYNRLQPSEQDQTWELYGRGLGVDPRDVLESSRRASPAGTRFGSAFYGG